MRYFVHCVWPAVRVEDPTPHSTIDAAIHGAREVFRSTVTSGFRAFVVEVDGSSRQRCFVDKTGLHWLVTCPKCSGAGQIMRQVKVGAKAVSFQGVCTRCNGNLMVREDGGAP